MNSSDEIYRPSPELARNHLRNAIEHLLQRQPVQGKVALDRLVTDVESEYFPTNTEDAVKYFSVGPLTHPKVALVRNFVIALTKSLLIAELDSRKWDRYIAALQAVIHLQSDISHQTLVEKLNNIVIRLPDQHLIAALRYVASIQEAWQHLNEDFKSRLRNYVMNLPIEQEVLGLNFAFQIVDLETESIYRINLMGLQNFIALSFVQALINKNVRPKIVEKAVNYYIGSDNFAAANDIGSQLIIPLAKYLQPAQIEQIVRACAENGQIRESYQKNAVLHHIRKCEIIPIAEFNELLVRFGILPIDPQEAPAAK